ncbi:MAG: hypothetical protein IID61_07070, partial [SAR324 cluster bacterium]|nr:hypothetical protein [SAR324 cluster bacterium]
MRHREYKMKLRHFIAMAILPLLLTACLEEAKQGSKQIPEFQGDSGGDTGTNTAPVAVDISIATAKDTPVDITLSATDADGDSLTFTVVSDPASGTLSASEPAEVVLDIRADSHRDVEALLAAVDDSAGPLPFALEGATTVTMILSSPTGLIPFADVQVEADVSTGAIRYRDYRWKRLAASVELLGGRLVVRNGRAADGTGSIEFSATASIEEGGSPSDWPFTLHAEATDLDVSRLVSNAGLSTDATGSLEATADFHGPWHSLAWTIDFLVR